MNRDQASAVLANVDLLKHFAEGGDIGFRVHDYKGKYVRTYPSTKVNLCCLHDSGTNYVKLKPKFRLDTKLGVVVRVGRFTSDPVHESEILKE